jgi:beta-lactam-binding protein with PASTA domain/predicted Ser/Thr protein kinase
MSEFEAGSTIDGRYRVLSRIGAGGMADVYLAQDEQLGREVAVKLLHRRFSEDPAFVERFRREAQAAASLQHPNVVSVFDRGSFDGTYYIAMEFLPGRSLKQLIREEAPLEPGRAVDLTVQILKAARFAHRRNVIHRDLKPHNVIVDDNDHAKVTDFGIARAGASDMTETGSIMGTAQYLSPEQAQGHTVSAPSDLYSVAIVLYEMLTGRVPFEGDSAVTIALKHVSETPVPPSQLNPAVSPALDQVVMWALNKDPADRPADADQFIAALEQVRGAVTGPVGEITATMRAVSVGTDLVPTGYSVGDDTGAYSGSALLPAADAVGVYGNAQNPRISGDKLNRYDDDKDDRHGSPIWPWLVGLLVLLLVGGGITAFLLTRPGKVSVPPVVGLSLPIAQGKLDTLNLNPNPIYETSASAQANTVINQVPTAGAKVKSGSSVTLTVSSGAGSVQVPTVVSLTKKQALAALKQSGLKVSRIITQSASDVDQNDAIGTSPQAGTSVAHGSPVVLILSSGTALPNVVGDTLTAAQAALTGFTVVTKQEVSPTAAVGTVLSQSPAANTPVASNATVTLTVAEAPKTATVPDVVGYTKKGAASTLQAAGFNVVELPETVNNPSEVGDVVRQRPQPQTTHKKGSIVTIIIGEARAITTTATTTPPPPTTTTTTTTATTTTTTGQSTTTP